MVRGLWLLAAAVAGLSVAFLLFPQAPAGIDALMAAALGKPPATPYSAPYIAFAAAVSIGLFVFFLATVVAAAVLESLNLATATTQTAALIRQQKKGEPVYAHDFLATTDVESVKPFAEQYAQDIHLEPAATLPGAAPAAAKPGGKAAPPKPAAAGRYVSERPAQTVFLTRAFLERPLFLDMLRPLPSIFFGLSAFGLLIGLVDGLARARLPLDNPGDGFSRGFEAGLVAATLPLLLGVLCWFLSELIVSRRIRLAQQFCRLLDQLFPPVTANHYIRQLAAWAARATGQTPGAAPDGATDALVAGIGAELTRQFGRLEMSLEAQEKNRGDSLKQAIEGGLKKPLGQLTDTATRLAGDQTGQVEKLLDKTLAAFAKQLKQILGGDLEGLAKVLTETAERLKTITDKLAATPAAADGEAAGPIAGEVQAALTELTGAVTEALAKLDATQARLIATLEDERAAGTAIATAARDLEAVTQANRDTVERFVDLAGELTKLSSQTAAQPAAAPAASKTGAGGDAQPKRAANDIIRALEELRAESEEAAKSLPKI